MFIPAKWARHPGFGVVSAGFGYWDGLVGFAALSSNLNKANEIISAEPNILLVNSWDGVKGHAAGNGRSLVMRGRGVGHGWNVGAVNVGLHYIQPNLLRVMDFPNLLLALCSAAR